MLASLCLHGALLAASSLVSLPAAGRPVLAAGDPEAGAGSFTLRIRAGSDARSFEEASSPAADDREDPPVEESGLPVEPLVERAETPPPAADPPVPLAFPDPGAPPEAPPTDGGQRASDVAASGPVSSLPSDLRAPGSGEVASPTAPAEAGSAGTRAGSDPPSPQTASKAGSAGAGSRGEPLEREPVAIGTPRPDYPQLSVRLGEQGRVECSILVGIDGAVISVEVLKSSGHARLDEAAAGALRRWRFTPGRRSGGPAQVRVRHAVTFRLE